MRKALLMMAVMASFGMSHAHAEEQWLAHDRTNWSISGCSQFGRNGGSNDGSLSDIIDATDATVGSGTNAELSFWHTNHEDDNEKTTSGHFFIIDRGESAANTPFAGFGYSPRKHQGGNGFLVDYSVYVVDDITGINTVAGDSHGKKSASNGHSSLATFLTGKTAAASGTITPRFDAGSSYNTSCTERRVKFDQQQTGRYVIFVFDKTSDGTSGGDGNLHATCADFQLYDVWESADRSGWSISGCSQWGHSDGGDDGKLGDIIDGDTSTYWHTEYNNDATNTSDHFFIIDRGEGATDKPFGSFGYLPRQGSVTGGNGYLVDYSIYVVDDVTGISTISGDGKKHDANSHTSLATFLSGKTAAASGTITPAISRTDTSTQYERQISFDQQQTGRYVIFVFEKTSGAQDESASNGNKHATCAEFYLYNTAVVPAPVEPQPVDPKAEALSTLEAMKKAPVIWSDVDAAIARLNELPDDATSAQIDEILAEVYNSAIGRTVRLYNVKSTIDHQYYLHGQEANVVVMDTKVSTGNDTNLTLYWTIKGTATPGVYQLENYSLGTLVGFPGTQSTILPLGSTGADFEIIVPTDVDDGSSIIENQIVFRSINHRNANVSCIHYSGSGVMGWKASSAGTQWRAYAPYAANVTVELSAANDWTISGTGITLNATRNANHKLTITPVTSAMTREVTYPHEVELTAKEDGSGFTMNMANVPAGEYTLQAPMGYFSLYDGAVLSNPINQTIVHQGTTSISEVSADEPAATEWYDLSGRRVTNPAKGFYINNRGEKIRL